MWDTILLDIHEVFGVDLWEEQRSWHWVRKHIEGLMHSPVQNYRPDGVPIMPNRTLATLRPAK